MPKLLDYISQSGYSHEEVIKLLESNPKPSESEEIEESEEEAEELEPEEIEDSVSEEGEEKEEKTFSLSKDELNKLINDAIDQRLKATRTAPPKGKPKDLDKVKDKGVIQKNMFEVIV